MANASNEQQPERRSEVNRLYDLLECEKKTAKHPLLIRTVLNGEWFVEEKWISFSQLGAT
jgi:hypothetical protein